MLCKGLSLCQNEHDASGSVLVLLLSWRFCVLLYLIRVFRAKFAAKTAFAVAFGIAVTNRQLLIANCFF